MSWTQPTCEPCWIKQHASYNEDDVLIGIDRPVMVRDDIVQQCAYCGAPTIVGIYTRADPATVPFPRKED